MAAGSGKKEGGGCDVCGAAAWGHHEPGCPWDAARRAATVRTAESVARQGWWHLRTAGMLVTRQSRVRRAGKPDVLRAATGIAGDRLTEPEKEAIRAALAIPDQIVVGMLYQTSHMYGEACHVFRNVSESPERTFALSVEDMALMHMLDEKYPGGVRTLWHSHPGRSMLPSEYDKRVQPPWVQYLGIVVPHDRAIHYFERVPR